MITHIGDHVIITQAGHVAEGWRGIVSKVYPDEPRLCVDLPHGSVAIVCSDWVMKVDKPALSQLHEAVLSGSRAALLAWGCDEEVPF